MSTAVTAASWRLRLLGGLRLESLVGDMPPVTQFRTQKAALLLAYLALHPGPQPREVLLTLLWPDALPEAARNSLSVALSSLRHQLEPPGTPAGAVVTADRQSIGVREGVLLTDVAAFRRAERQKRFEEAAHIYEGPLLPGFYDDWVLAEREHLSESYAALVLGTLPKLPVDAVRHWRQRACQADPDNALLYRESVFSASPPQPQVQSAFAELRDAEDAADTRTVTVVALSTTGALAKPTAWEGPLRHHRGALLGEHLWGFSSAVEAVGFASACLRLSAGECACALCTSEVPGSGKFLATPAADAERLLPLVRAGHVVCTETTAALLRATRPAGLELHTLGAFSLTDERNPEPLFEVRMDGQSAAVAPALVEESQQTVSALPAYPTRFFGRVHEQERLLAALGDARLVTLLGPGGVGKTRLLIETLRRVSEQGQVICFIPLAERTETTALWGAVRAALRLPLQGDERSGVLQSLRERPVLLALDNLEHLLEPATALVAELLEAVPELHLLTTSRHVLGLPGEHVFPLDPLPLPTQLAEPAALLVSSPAVALFCDRARAALPDFVLTPRNAETVVALCRRLDGIPLALELTASRARVLTPGQWLERLERGLDAVAVTARAGVPERHRSLVAALRWSYDLLPPDTRAFFPKLSVFRGSWSLEAAEAITGEPLALDHLAVLLENALMLSEITPEGMRFRMLETIREFATGLLTPEEYARLTQCHTAFILKLVGEAAAGLSGANQAEWLARLEQDRENLNLALEESLALKTSEGDARALELASRLTLFWELRGHFDEGRRFQKRVRDAVGESGDPARRAELLGGSWSLAICQGDFPAALGFAEQELALRRVMGEPLGIARALHRRAGLELRQGRYETAEALLQESIALKKAHAAPVRELVLSLLNLGVIANEKGDCTQGAEYFTECLVHTRRDGIQSLTAMALNNLGMSREYLGDLAAALEHFTESLVIKEALGDKRGTAVTLQNVARILRVRGDGYGARERLLQSLQLLLELGDAHFGIITIHGLGVLAATLEQQPLAAARLWGCWEATSEVLKTPLSPLDRETTEAQFRETRAACDQRAAYDAAWIAGRQTNWKTLANEILASPLGSPP